MAGNQITYLFGAGASANAVPVVSNFAKNLNDFRNWVGLTKGPLLDHIKEIRGRFIEDLTIVIEGCKDHYSIDTYAKKLYLTEQHEKLKRLKRILDAFLIHIHFTGNNNIDKRYDAFIAAIMQEGPNNEFYFPSNLKILSWNYDIQFELASQYYFSGLKPEIICNNRLQMIPNHSKPIINTQLFSYVKLNGTSGAEIIKDRFYMKWQDYITFLGSPSNSGLLTKILYDYNERRDANIVPALTFAWEHNSMSVYSWESAKDIAEKTNILVVIGYSFPSFNRSLDKTLLNSMPKLEEVVIQTKDNTVNEIISKVSSIRNDITINSHIGVEEFHIPTSFFPEEVLELKPEGVK